MENMKLIDWFLSSMSNEYYLREFLIDPKDTESLYFVLGLLELSIQEFLTKSQ